MPAEEDPRRKQAHLPPQKSSVNWELEMLGHTGAGMRHGDENKSTGESVYKE